MTPLDPEEMIGAMRRLTVHSNCEADGAIVFVTKRVYRNLFARKSRKRKQGWRQLRRLLTRAATS